MSSQTCEMYNPEECDCTIDDYNNNVCSYQETIAANCWWWTEYEVKRGLCSERTKELLTTDQQNCIHPLWSQKRSVFWTAFALIRSVCGRETSVNFFPAPLDQMRVKRFRNKKKNRRKKRRKNKVNFKNKKT